MKKAKAFMCLAKKYEASMCLFGHVLNFFEVQRIHVVLNVSCAYKKNECTPIFDLKKKVTRDLPNNNILSFFRLQY